MINATGVSAARGRIPKGPPAQMVGARIPERTVILLDAVSRARGDNCRSKTIRAALDAFIMKYVNVEVKSQETEWYEEKKPERPHTDDPVSVTKER